MIRNNDDSIVTIVGKDAVMLGESRNWVTVYTGRGKMGGPGMPVMQSIPAPSPTSDDMRRAAGYRVSGVPACGAHTRRQSVREINSEG